MNIKEGAKKMRETARDVVGKISKREVKIFFHKPDAKKVYLAGDFNSWDTGSMPMKMEKDGTWSATLKLAPGHYQYGFLADGTWVKDLPCSEAVINPFGTYNCVLKVK